MKKMVQRICMVIGILAISSSLAYAADSFSVAPPPIAAPTFEEGKSDGKVQLTYLTMSGNGTDFKGYGADAVFRKAFSGNFAGDFQTGMFIMSGDMNDGAGGKSSTTIGNFLFGVNGEYQAYKGDAVSVLLFAGPNITLILGNTKMGTETDTLSGDLFGLEGGVQLGIKAGDFQFAPFAMIMSQQGSMTVTTAYGDFTTNIDPFVTTSFGMDVAYIPWNVTLSAILQEAAKQKDDKEGMKTSIYQISWHF
jgi:hypothetical protein